MININQIITSILPQIVQLRHQIHQFPELSGQEYQTAELIRRVLGNTAFRTLPPYLETDVVAILETGKNGKNIVLRADMDALAQEEMTELPYASQNPNVMHACGHDGHIAMMLGTAMILSEVKAELTGTIKLIFQPGEEVGAMGKLLAEAGALENPAPDYIFALHGMNGFAQGDICCRKGIMTAANNRFELKIIGRGGHASAPEKCVDPVIIAGNIINAWQSIISRNITPGKSAIISIGSINGGSAWNAIADSIVLEGSVRCFDHQLSDFISQRMSDIAETVAEGLAGRVEFDYQKLYIPTNNSPAAVEIIRSIAGEKYIELQEPLPIGEDFSFYVDKYPGALALLGLGKEQPPLHRNDFDFPDNCLATGVIFLCRCVKQQVIND